MENTQNSIGQPRFVPNYRPPLRPLLVRPNVFAYGSHITLPRTPETPGGHRWAHLAPYIPGHSITEPNSSLLSSLAVHMGGPPVGPSSVASANQLRYYTSGTSLGQVLHTPCADIGCHSHLCEISRLYPMRAHPYFLTITAVHRCFVCSFQTSDTSILLTHIRGHKKSHIADPGSYAV